jgi:carboxyl-terminal processing protease
MSARMRLLVLTFALLGCASGDSTTEPVPVSNAATEYLDHVLSLMQNNSIKQLTINWTAFRADVHSRVAGATTIAETYPAITHALTLLGDGHSSYRASDGRVLFVPNRICNAIPAPTPSLPANIGYIRIGSFSGTGFEAAAFASGIQATIKNADRADLIGWIVDLRGNGGGDMGPMIAGVGPILGEDTLGFFIDPLGRQSAWEYRAGAAILSGNVMFRVDSIYRLLRERPRVAVLTDKRVASSGEATLIAFRRRPNTRSFGTSTCGLSTANRGFPLYDGAFLTLTVSVMADRTRFQYGDVIAPDELILSTPDAVVARAIAWLQTGN